MWDSEKRRWILVDPDREKVDLPRGQFETGGEVWLQVREERVDPQIYTSSTGRGIGGIVHILCHDISCLLLEEKPYWEDPAIVGDLNGGIESTSEERLAALDRTARLTASGEVSKDVLREVVEGYPFLLVGEN